MKLVNKLAILPMSSPHPVSNGTMGESYFACDCETNLSSLYTIFSENLLQLGTIGSWLSWYYKDPAKLTSIYIYKDNSPADVTIANIQGSNDYTNWTDISFTTQSATIGSQDILVELTNNNFYSYYKITFDTSVMSASIALKLSGTFQSATTTTIRQTIRKYYKYSISPWTQPVLTSDGLIGGYNMAVEASSYYSAATQTWHAFDGDTGEWRPNLNYPITLIIYNPIPINATNFQFTNYSHNQGAPIDFSISASNDNVNYTLLGSFTNTVQTANATWNADLSSNTGYYQYYKMECTNWANSSYGRGIKEIDITATQKTIIESTSSDYDFYEDVNAYMAVI